MRTALVIKLVVCGTVLIAHLQANAQTFTPPYSGASVYQYGVPYSESFLLGIGDGGFRYPVSEHPSDPASGILTHDTIARTFVGVWPWSPYFSLHSRYGLTAQEALIIPVQVAATGRYTVKTQVTFLTQYPLPAALDVAGVRSFGGNITISMDAAEANTQVYAEFPGIAGKAVVWPPCLQVQESPMEVLDGSLLDLYLEILDTGPLSSALALAELMLPVHLCDARTLTLTFEADLVAGPQYLHVGFISNLTSDSANPLLIGEGGHATEVTAFLQVDHIELSSTIPTQGNDFELVDTRWVDEGDEDGVLEFGEDVRVQIKLRNKSGVTLAGVEGTLASPDPGIDMFAPDGWWNDCAPGQSVWQDGRFGMEVGLSGSQPKSVGFILTVTYLRGSQDCYQYLSPFTKIFYQQGYFAASFNVPTCAIDDSQSIRPYNNGDGIPQSGERVRLRPRLCNNGQAMASDINTYLSAVNPPLDINPGDEEHYPDLDPSECGELASGDYYVADISPAFAGEACIDVHAWWDQHTDPITLPCELALYVQAAPWLSVDDSWYFGMTAPESDVSHPVQIGNTGTADLNVTGFVVQSCDGSPAGDVTVTPPSITIPPQQTRTVTVTLHTSGLNGQICRRVAVISNGRVYHAGEDDVFLLSGFVSEPVPLYRVPTPEGTTIRDPDISGTRVVWTDGQGDIRGYDAATQQLFDVCTHAASQHDSYISGDLVVWDDLRNWTGNPNSPCRDIYAKRLSTGEEFIISADPAQDEHLLGVDGNRVAFVKRYHVLPEIGYNWLYNLMVAVIPESGAPQLIPLSSFSANATHQPMDSYSYGDADFAEGFLVVSRYQIVWRENSWWETTNRKMEYIDFAAGGSSPSLAFSGSVRWPGAAAHRFVYADSLDEDYREETIVLWRTSGTTEQIAYDPECEFDDDWVAVGGPEGADVVVYRYNCNDRPGLYYRDRGEGGIEKVISASADTTDKLRIDEYGVTWVNPQPNYGLFYAFLKQADIAITCGSPTFSMASPIEGQQIDVSMVIRNITENAETDDIVVRLYLGDPDAGGTQIGSDQTVSGGLGASASQTVTFAGITVPPVTSGDEQSYQVCSKVFVTGVDNPENNEICCTLHVQDNDTQGPQILTCGVIEHNGNGDGVISDTEQARIYWSLYDPSGIGSLAIRLDGGAPLGSLGDGFVIVGPLAPGPHEVSLQATDADLTPESASRTISLLVDACPNDPDKILPGACGCGATDTDRDNDGTLDCNDECPDDPQKTLPGLCDCGVPDSLWRTWYPDVDGDTYGDAAATPITDCSEHPGHVLRAGDCDDGDDTTFPGAPEPCDGFDHNCDDQIAPVRTWYRDADGDGYGDATEFLQGCSQPSGYVSNNIDCDDSNAAIHPGATEVCTDLVDNNCNGLVDTEENPPCGVPPPPYSICHDADGDGYGDPQDCVFSSEVLEGWVDNDDDCDDNDSAVHPGATELCDGKDNDCDGQVEEGTTNFCGICLGPAALSILGICGMKLRLRRKRHFDHSPGNQ